MASELMGTTHIINAIPNATDKEIALAKAYLEKRGHEDIIEMLGL